MKVAREQSARTKYQSNRQQASTDHYGASYERTNKSAKMMVDMDDYYEEKKKKSSDKTEQNKNMNPTDAEAKDEEVVDFTNFKGLYFGNDNEKQTDDETGAHFIRKDLFVRLSRAKLERIKREDEWDEQMKKY